MVKLRNIDIIEAVFIQFACRMSKQTKLFFMGYITLNVNTKILDTLGAMVNDYINKLIDICYTDYIIMKYL